MDENNPDHSAEQQGRGRVAEHGPGSPRRRLIISRNSSVLSNGNLDRSRSPLSRLPLVNLSDVQAGLEELGGPSATPIRGPNRFMPVLSGLGVFKVPFPFFPPPEPVIPATQSERTKNSVALEHEFVHTKFLVNWVPRLQGRKLIVEGNLLDLSAENPFATVDRWKSSRLISVDMTGTKVSTSKTTYVLEGKLCSSECDELTPNFIKVAFRNGFPQNWKLFQDQWRTFVKGQLDNDRSSNATCMTVQSAFVTGQQQQHLSHPSASGQIKNFQSESVLDPPAAGSVEVVDKNLAPKSPQKSKLPLAAPVVVKAVAAEIKSPLKVSAAVVDDGKKRTEERKKLELQRKEEAKRRRVEQRKLAEQKKEEKQREAKRIREEKKQETERKKKEASLAREKKILKEKDRKEPASRSRSRRRMNNSTLVKDSSIETGSGRRGDELEKSEQQKDTEDDKLAESEDMEKAPLVGVEKTKQTRNQNHPDRSKAGKKTEVTKVPENKRPSSKRVMKVNENSKAAPDLCESSSADFTEPRRSSRLRANPVEPLPIKKSTVQGPKRRGRKPKSIPAAVEKVAAAESPKPVPSQRKPAQEIQKHLKSPLRSLPPKTGFNPNPKTAADYRRNTQVLEEINKNHEDVLFQVPSKHKPKDVPPALCANAIRVELFNSDSENDYSVHSARTPIQNYFDKSDTEITRMEDLTARAIGEKEKEVQHNAFINRQLKDGRKMSKKKILKLDPAPPPRPITKEILMSPQLLASVKQIKEIRQLPTDAIQDDESDADMMSGYFTDDQSMRPESLSSVPAGLLELYENQQLEESKNPSKQNPRKKFYF